MIPIMSFSKRNAFILLNLLRQVHVWLCVHLWAAEISLVSGEAQREIIDGGMKRAEAEMEARSLEGCGIAGMNT